MLGFYNPLVKPTQVSVNLDRVAYWKSQGAVVSPGVEKLLAKTP